MTNKSPIEAPDKAKAEKHSPLPLTWVRTKIFDAGLIVLSSLAGMYCGSETNSIRGWAHLSLNMMTQGTPHFIEGWTREMIASSVAGASHLAVMVSVVFLAGFKRAFLGVYLSAICIYVASFGLMIDPLFIESGGRVVDYRSAQLDVSWQLVTLYFSIAAVILLSNRKFPFLPVPLLAVGSIVVYAMVTTKFSSGSHLTGALLAVTVLFSLIATTATWVGYAGKRICALKSIGALFAFSIMSILEMGARNSIQIIVCC